MANTSEERYKNPFQATLAGISDLFKKPKKDAILKDSDRLEGKRALVTGASSGLGFAVAVQLAKRGAEVIMACRSGIPEKGEEARRLSGSDKIHMVHVDFTDPESIKNYVNEVAKKFGTIDILVSNAGVVTKKSRKTSIGLDEMFMVNYLSKFMAIGLMLKKGILKSSNGDIPRIVVVSSESHRNAREFDWEGFGIYKETGIGKTVENYGYNKLLLTTYVNELSRRLNPNSQTNISVFSLCPGPVNSNIAREVPAIFKPLLKLVFSLFFRSPEKAAEPVIYMASSKGQEGKALDYIFLLECKAMDEKATDPANGKRLWEKTEALIDRLGIAGD